MKLNHKNDGREFEGRFGQTCEAYRQKKILRLEKVGPPCRIIFKGPGQQQIIFLDNPFLDWVGTWVERNGRCLMIETKSTSEPKLQMGKSNKLSDHQVEWLMRWHYAGAAVGLVWEYVGTGVAFIPIGQLHDIRKSGRRHIKWEEVAARQIKQGVGFVLLDFVPYLRQFYDATCQDDGKQFIADPDREDVQV